MPKTTVVFAFAAVVFLALTGCGRTTPRMYRVGVLSGLDFFSTISDGFRKRLTELGYTEGTVITYDIQKTGFNIAKYRSILRKFVADRVDLILVFPTEASMEAKAITRGTGIPVIFASVFTENTDLASTVQKPGGNITGVRWDGPDMALKRFETMRELVPQARSIWVPYQRDYPTVKNQLEVLRKVFPEEGMEMIEIPADNAEELKQFIDSASASGRLPDAVLIIAEPLMVSPEPANVMADFSMKYGIPAGGNMMPSENNGSLFGLVPDNIAQGRQAAFIADKILRGTSAGTIPVVTAENFLTINYRIAVRLGLTVNEGLLARAHRILR